MKHNLVSIIVPCKNADRWIGETIESCLRQSWEDIEILVVDNGSTDHSVSVANKYKSRGIRILECDKPGASAARNVGLNAASGEFIQFLDADDVLAEKKIEAQMQRLAKGSSLVSAICKWATFSDSIEESQPVDESIFCDQKPVDFLVQLWQTRTMMALFSWLVPRKVIERAGPWLEDLSWDDDGEFFTRVALASEAIVSCEGAYGYYRRTSFQSLSKRQDKEAMRSAYFACDRSTRALLAREDSPRTRLASAAKFQYFVHLAYPTVPRLVRDAEEKIVNFGASPQSLDLGGRVAFFAWLFGWKCARRLQYFYRRLNFSTSLRPSQRP